MQLSEIISLLDSSPNLPQAFFDFCKTLPEGEMYRWGEQQEENRVWRSRTREEVAQRIRIFASYLFTQGVKRGDHVAIISNTRPEWSEADLAILSVGGVTVSVYPSLTTNDMAYILHDSEVEVVIAENQEQVDKLFSLQNNPQAIPANEEHEALEVTLSLRLIITFEKADSFSQYEEILSDTTRKAKELEISLQRSDIASIVYTSGTTGAPKGVIQSHGNHLSNVRQAAEGQIFGTDGSLFLYLPLAHSFARLVHYIGALTTSTLVYPTITDRGTSKLDLVSIARDIHEAGANYLPSVPRLFEKMKSSLEEITKKDGLSNRLIGFTLCWSLAFKSQSHPSLLSYIRYLAVAPLRTKIRHRLFGVGFRHAISGGAKLNPDVCRFFDALGIEIFEGYGLTETCVATNVNRVGRRKIGSVGPAFTDIETKIASDGEILYRGPNIAIGYFKRPEATKTAWDQEGWFHTGDVGYLDEEGFLFITDRKKDLIVTAGGKNIAPQMLENLFKGCELLSQVVVIGDGQPYCAALVTIDSAQVEAWAKKRQIALQKPYSINPQIRETIQIFLEKMNQKLASFEQIKKFAILPNDFTIENGLLTPTLKPKRKEVLTRFHQEVASLYEKS